MEVIERRLLVITIDVTIKVLWQFAAACSADYGLPTASQFLSSNRVQWANYTEKVTPHCMTDESMCDIYDKGLG
jgi:hypothetical protein